jgi:hypothetical protein
VRTDPSRPHRSHSLNLHRLAGLDYFDPDVALLPEEVEANPWNGLADP